MKQLSAAAYMVLSAFFLSLMSVMVKAGGVSIPPMEMVFIRSVLVFLITLVLVKRQGIPLWGNNKKLLLLRGFFGFFGLSAFFYTLTKIPIADSVTLQYTSPLFTALLAQPILKEKSTRRQWGYFLLAFLGLLLIVRPGFSLQFFPALIGVFGAFFAALAYNTVRKLRHTDHPLTVVLYFPLVSSVLSFPLTAFHFVMPRGWQWLLLLGIGICAFIAQLFMTRALHLDRAARVMNISYVGVVFSTLLGILFFSEIPDWRTLAGAGVIIYAIVHIARNGEEV